MQREIIEKIKKIEKEQMRRYQNDTLLRYNAGKKKHKKQIKFHKCKKKNRWVFGGNRTGKTECGAVEVIYIARGIHPYRKNKNNVFGVNIKNRGQFAKGIDGKRAHCAEEKQKQNSNKEIGYSCSGNRHSQYHYTRHLHRKHKIRKRTENNCT